MKIEIIPTKFELYDGTDDEPLAKLEMFDEHCTSVTISTVVNPALWVDLSAAILTCLQQMHPEGEK